MILHANVENGAASFVMPAKPVLPGGMYLVNDLFFFRDLIRFVFFEPFDPIPPHLDYFFSLEFPSDAEPGYGVNICVEVLLGFELFELRPKDVFELLLEGLDLGQFAVCYEEGVRGGLHAGGPVVRIKRILIVETGNINNSGKTKR